MQQCCKVMVNNSLIQPAAHARDDLDHAIAGYAAASNCGGSSCQANEARTQYAISRMDFRFRGRDIESNRRKRGRSNSPKASKPLRDVSSLKTLKRFYRFSISTPVTGSLLPMF